MVHRRPVIVDPFHPSVVGATRSSSGEKGSEDAVEDYLFGRDCAMEGEEWVHFCREVLLLETAIPQTMDGVVGMVDDMVTFIVRAVAGCPDFAVAPGARLMSLVVVLVRFYLLCGGSGCFPREYALARFGGLDPMSSSDVGVSDGGRARASKIVRRLVSLGRCVRGLLRVAWEHSMWRDADLFRLLGLEADRDYRFCDVWRAAVGPDTGMGLFMYNLIGPSYFAVCSLAGAYEDHEYSRPYWNTDLPHCPMSSETLAGGGAALIVAHHGKYLGFGGFDRQRQVFQHNLLWGFMEGRKYRRLAADKPFPMDVLAAFGIRVGVGADGETKSPGRFSLGDRFWFVGGADGLGPFGEVDGSGMSKFFSPLDGDGGRVGGRFGQSVVQTDAVRREVASYALRHGWSEEDIALIANVSLEDF